jgi:hypothetical protein
VTVVPVVAPLALVHGALLTKCTKIRIAKAFLLTKALCWCACGLADFSVACRGGALIPRECARSKVLRRLGAWVAQKLLYWFRSTYPARLSAIPPIEGGRAGTGQLDWAAAESAEFVNQEIGYE